MDAFGFVAVDATKPSHLSRIERQPVCEGELVVLEVPAAVGLGERNQRERIRARCSGRKKTPKSRTGEGGRW